MLKQSLESEIKIATGDLEEAKKGIAESSEKKATAEGDLDATSKELAADVKAKGSLHQDCMSKASAFEAETKSRGEELRALATAKDVIEKATGGAAFSQQSFLQVGSALASGKALHRFQAVRIIRDLAHKQHSSALVQLASQMAAAMNSGDAFEKVKGLISDMIAKLEKEAGADATKKAFCDKELVESNAKKSDKSDEISKLSTQIEKATFAENKAELEKGIAGIKAALQILTEYYA